MKKIYRICPRISHMEQTESFGGYVQNVVFLGKQQPSIEVFVNQDVQNARVLLQL